MGDRQPEKQLTWGWRACRVWRGARLLEERRGRGWRRPTSVQGLWTELPRVPIGTCSGHRLVERVDLIGSEAWKKDIKFWSGQNWIRISVVLSSTCASLRKLGPVP